MDGLRLLITIITVCFNSATTIADTLRSVSMQRNVEFEHIIIDGASTDTTLEVVKANGGHVARIISEPDHGIYDAMNKGVKIANGDVIAFLNADDIYIHDHVLSNVHNIMSSGAVDVLFGDVVYVDPVRPGSRMRRYNSGRFTPARLAWGWMPAHPALFMKRDVFTTTGMFRTDYKIAGDYEYVVRAFSRSSWSYQHVREVLVHMRTGGISTRGFRNTLLLNREVLRALRENDINSGWLKVLSKYPAKLLEYFHT